MFSLIEKGRTAEIFCDSPEALCIRKAVDDLVNDIRKISGKVPERKAYLPEKENGFLVVGSLDNPRFADYVHAVGIDPSRVEGRWEACLMKTFGRDGNNLLLCGSDPRGAMWGIYDLCEKVLKVDPLYLWTGNEPAEQEEVLLDEVDSIICPETFKFRGWFINDEDILSSWKENSGRRNIDYPFYHQVMHPTLMQKVIETALRLKQNLMIPESFVDIDNPAEEDLVRQVTERGLFITQHHVEPMGVSHFGWENYWKRRGITVAPSYVRSPERFEEIWTHYAEKWAQYKNVIFQLGLRGRADRPVWDSDESVPASMEERGRLISSAIRKQKEIIEKALGTKNFYSSSTLWMEGTQLHHDGYLNFPEDTLLIFADNGPTQMLGEDFYSVERLKTNSYGIYYHVAFWDCGPHIVQGTSLDKICYNYQKAVEKGDTTYSILNVSNIRELVFGIRAVAELTWNFDSFDRKRYLHEWCVLEFGEKAAKEVSDVYCDFYRAYPSVKSDRVPDQTLLLDGVIRKLGYSLINMDRDFSKDGSGSSAYFDSLYFDYKDYDAFIKGYQPIIERSLSLWEKVYEKAFSVQAKIRPDRRQFFVDNIIVELETVLGLYKWFYCLLLARENERKGDYESFNRNVGEAVFALEKLMTDRTKAEHDSWYGWYQAEKKMNIPEMLSQTRTLLDGRS